MMVDTQDLDVSKAYAIRHDVLCLRDHKLSRSWYAAGMSKHEIFRKKPVYG